MNQWNRSVVGVVPPCDQESQDSNMLEFYDTAAAIIGQDFIVNHSRTILLAFEILWPTKLGSHDALSLVYKLWCELLSSR